MQEYRRLATRIDQHVQQLIAQGVIEDAAIFNRMMGCIPDLHRIWVETTNQQLIALSNEFTCFYRYAVIVENGYPLDPS